jgi:hypothetical protein
MHFDRLFFSGVTIPFLRRKDPGYISKNIRDSQNQRDDVSLKDLETYYDLLFISLSPVSF